MTIDELRAKWEARAAEHARLGALVSGSTLIGDLLADVAQLSAPATDADEIPRSLTDASRITHYHAGSLARLIKLGRLTNYGSARRPRVKVSECPRRLAKVEHAPHGARPAPTDGTSSVAQSGRPAASSVAAAIGREALAGRFGRRSRAR